ncbi:MAG TPA: GNAT family N-acetyltransferase [Candidatus Kapabacteria bacterium]|nr:GNAT family N-acetyltransferase [Candidatus Kapabacteria bacterium]
MNPMTAPERSVTVRPLKPEEWHLLDPVFREQGGQMPHHECGARVLAAFDEDGLAGFWTLQPMWWAGPLWIRPDHRGSGLWRRLHNALDALFARSPGTGYYSFTGEPKMETVLQELGYRDLPYKIWVKEAS